MALQAYYDRTEINFEILSEDRDTIDLDFQHRFSIGGLQEVVWGLGYRHTKDKLENSFHLTVDPDSRSDNLYSAFVQDELRLLKDKLFLTLGSKFEYNNYTGFEVQPSARALWTPSPDQSIWAAVSRAVRTPSRSDDDVRINRQVVPGAPPVLVSVFGDRDFDSEELLAFELGYRVRPEEWVSLDIATFYNLYDNLRTLELGSTFIEASPAPLHAVLPSTAANRMDGKTYGVELAADVLALDWLNLQLAYTFLQIELDLEAGSTDSTSRSAEGESPHHQVSLRSSMDLGNNIELDMWVRHVGKLPSLDIESYTGFDARLGWRPRSDMELSLVGKNLFENQHQEFKPELIDVIPTEVERSVYGKVTWRF
jgi:iron complex outermembrane receptor protein